MRVRLWRWLVNSVVKETKKERKVRTEKEKCFKKRRSRAYSKK